LFFYLKFFNIKNNFKKINIFSNKKHEIFLKINSNTQPGIDYVPTVIREKDPTWNP